MNDFSSPTIIKNFMWLCFGQYGGMVCTISCSIWLTRLLSPEDYGLIALSLSYFSFFNWLLEWGWEQGFIAHKDIPLQKAAPTHFVIRMVLGLVPLVTFMCVSPLMIVEHSSRARIVLYLLSLIYWFERMGLTYKTILERTYQLQKLATLEFGIIIASYIAALVAAMHGWGVYALVLQRCVEKGFLSVGYMLASPWKFGGRFDFAIACEFFTSFGIPSWIGSIVSLGIYDGMPLVIRYMSTTHQVGLYAKAFSMATFPVMLTGIFSRLTTPLYTAYQHDVAGCRRVFIRAQTVKMLILVPTQLVMGLGAHVWIPRVLGPSWVEMVPIYQVMSIYGLFRAFFDDVPNVLTYGFKNPWALTKNQAYQSAVFITLGFPLAYYYHAFGGALAMSIMMSSATILFWITVVQTLGCRVYMFMDVVSQMPRIVRAKVLSWVKSS